MEAMSSIKHCVNKGNKINGKHCVNKGNKTIAFCNRFNHFDNRINK